MLKVIGSVNVEIISDKEKLKHEIPGSDFGLEEGGWRSLGDGDRQYEALFIYFGEDFKISFQAAYFGGQTAIHPLSVEGKVKIINEDIDVEYSGSSDLEDDNDD